MLVEPSPGLANNLKVLLSTIRNFRIVGHSTCGLDAMRKMSALSPDVLVLDLSLPDMTAMDIARWSQRLFPETSIVLLSSYDTEEYRQAAGQIRNTILLNKAELGRKMPQVLDRLWRDRLARDREMGAISVTRWNQQLRELASWIDNTAKVRNQAPVWRLIHLGMVMLSVELILALATEGTRLPELMLAGWGMIIVALAHDFYTLSRSAKPIAISSFGVGTHV